MTNGNVIAQKKEKKKGNVTGNVVAKKKKKGNIAT